jgi:hypothetical protein
MVMCAPIIERNFLEYNVNYGEMVGFIYNDDMPPLVSDDEMPPLVSDDEIPPLVSDDEMPPLFSDEYTQDVIYDIETYEMLERENPALEGEISHLQDYLFHLEIEI